MTVQCLKTGFICVTLLSYKYLVLVFTAKFSCASDFYWSWKRLLAERKIRLISVYGIYVAFFGFFVSKVSKMVNFFKACFFFFSSYTYQHLFREGKIVISTLKASNVLNILAHGQHQFFRQHTDTCARIKRTDFSFWTLWFHWRQIESFLSFACVIMLGSP